MSMKYFTSLLLFLHLYMYVHGSNSRLKLLAMHGLTKYKQHIRGNVKLLQKQWYIVGLS